MAKKKTLPKDVRIIQKQNNGSTTVALPPSLLQELKWKDKQKVVIRKRGTGILLEPWSPTKK